MRCEYLIETGFDKADPDRLEQPQAVERWFCNDWRRIETSKRKGRHRIGRTYTTAPHLDSTNNPLGRLTRQPETFTTETGTVRLEPAIWEFDAESRGVQERSRLRTLWSTG